MLVLLFFVFFLHCKFLLVYKLMMAEIVISIRELHFEALSSSFKHQVK